jgi:hypothetical protein
LTSRSAEQSQEREPVTETAFYCIADDDYFLGAVALVNSLRLLGHDEPVRMLDVGLRDDQRALLKREVIIMDGPRGAPPWLLKTLAPDQRPARVMILLDADLVAVRSLRPLIDRAASGRLVLFRNPIDRFVPEWGELLDLGRAQRRPYVSSAAIVAGTPLGDEVLALLADRQKAVDFGRTYWRGGELEYAFRFGDQDVLNAILAAKVEPGLVDVLDSRLAPTPPFAGLRVVDEGALRCAYADGEAPYLVHHHVTKPWLEPTYHGVYSRLLRRLLIGNDLALVVAEEDLPLRLRSGMLAWADRTRVNAREWMRWHVREPLRARSLRVPGRGGRG